MKNLITIIVIISIVFANSSDNMDSLRETILPNEQSSIVKINDILTGTLVRKIAETNLYEVLPELITNVDISIDGMVATTIVNQVFTNPTFEPIEAIYVFPLSNNAVVNDMKMIINNRFIQGEIKEKQEAKIIYEKAKQSGKRASLTEQQRPNIFTNSVANIMPGDTIIVQLSMVETIDFEDNTFKYRFPMVVAPRFIPGDEVTGYTGNGWAMDTNIVPDASKITPPITPPNMRSGSRLSLFVHLNAGLLLSSVKCRSHDIEKQFKDVGKYEIILSDGDVIPNKDFVLDYTIQVGKEPSAALFSTQRDSCDYFMLMAVPPKHSMAKSTIPKEFIFVIDVSGSMSGGSLDQACKSLEYAVKRLKPNDYFNIIPFSDGYITMKPQSIKATQRNIRKGVKFIRRLKTIGGTNALPALVESMKNNQQPNTVKMIVFITDGAVGNEKEIFKAVQQNIGVSRLFTISIGSAPNSYLLEKISNYGRGTFTYIGNINEVKTQMNNLFNKIESPVLTDIILQVDGSTELYPSRIPDLYVGQPMIVYGKAKKGSLSKGAFIGKINGQYFKKDLKINPQTGKHHSAIAPLWAQRKINDLTNNYFSSLRNPTTKQKVIDICMDFTLMSEFTSFVAVEEQIVNPNGNLHTFALPTELPEGWDFDKIFADAMSMKPVIIKQDSMNKQLEKQLPRTGTNEPLWLLIGLLTIVFSISTRHFLIRIK
jgi:Ca-activated chloride channel homolog